MRYMDVANRLVASPALSIDTKTAFDAVSVAVVALRAYQRVPVPSAVFLLTGNIGAATGRLVTSLYRTVSPPKGIVITTGSKLPTYTFSKIKFFFFYMVSGY